MKVLVVKPYSEKVLNAINEATDLNVGEYVLVGEKTLIIEKCFKNNIHSKKFTIYDIDDDLTIIDFCKRFYIENQFCVFLFDDYPISYQLKILELDNENQIGTIDIIDLPFLKHFLFISNYCRNQYVDFEDKKKAILQADYIMKTLDIKKTNVGLISYSNNKTDILESSIIKVILKENKINDINIYDNFDITTLFSKDNKVNIFKNNINLLIMRNYETSRIFIDTLNAFTSTKIASIMVGKHYAIDAKYLKDDNNLLFSIVLLDKIYRKTHVINQPKLEII